MDKRWGVGINVQSYFQSKYIAGELSELEYNVEMSLLSQIVEYPDGMRRKLREDLEDIWEEHENLDGWDVCGTELCFVDVVKILSHYIQYETKCILYKSR